MHQINCAAPRRQAKDRGANARERLLVARVLFGRIFGCDRIRFRGGRIARGRMTLVPRAIAHDVDRDAIEKRRPRLGRLLVAIPQKARDAFLRDILDVIGTHAQPAEEARKQRHAFPREAFEAFGIVLAPEESRHAEVRVASMRTTDMAAGPRRDVRRGGSHVAAPARQR